MCFSVQVERDLEKLAMRFDAKVSQVDFQKLRDQQNKAEALPPENLKKIMGLKRKPRSPLFKGAKKDGRIYPGYFAPVIVLENNKRVVKPMRYRVRPAGSAEEIPSKYNVFNARMDSLEKRKTWSSLFLRNHGLFPFKSFYEWVERDGKKLLINFNPQGREIMWAPMLFDTWQSAEKEIEFSSFALITTEPPPEVEAAGHDRCPVFLKENQIGSWLKSANLGKQQAYDLLACKEPVRFTNSFPAGQS